MLAHAPAFEKNAAARSRAAPRCAAPDRPPTDPRPFLPQNRILGGGKTVDSVWQQLVASRACDLSALDQLSAEEQQAQRE